MNTRAIRTQMLDSIVRVAQLIFNAAASSVFLWDPHAAELVFEAVAGAGGGVLPGTRLPGDRGIAGWVRRSQEPLIVHDLQANGVFALDLAESTGYVPDTIMAVPLVRGETCIGVLEVLDPVSIGADGQRDMEFLLLFAEQAALGLDLIRAEHDAQILMNGNNAEEVAMLLGIMQGLGRADPAMRAAGVRTLTAVGQMLGGEQLS